MSANASKTVVTSWEALVKVHHHHHNSKVQGGRRVMHHPRQASLWHVTTWTLFFSLIFLLCFLHSVSLYILSFYFFHFLLFLDNIMSCYLCYSTLYVVFTLFYLLYFILLFFSFFSFFIQFFQAIVQAFIRFIWLLIVNCLTFQYISHPYNKSCLLIHINIIFSIN